MDERRRRRLAVADGASIDSEPGEEKSLPDYVPAEWCAAAPWIPRSRWKLWTLTVLFLAGVTAVLFLTWRTPEFRPELAPALDPLFRGSQPRLVVYLQIIFWTLSGQLALLIGWHRSHSRLDFRGRYRFWPWASALMFGSGLCVATDLHLGLGSLLGRWEFFAQQPPSFAWLLPAACFLFPTAFLLDRDIRRSRASVILLRLTLCVFLAGGIGGAYGSLWLDQATVAVVESVCGFAGPALLAVTLWIHGWYVAYVTPDPPAAMPGKIWRASGAVLRWLIGWLTWPFRRSATVESATATQRRKKSEESAAPTRRKRKPRRKPRTRTKVVEEEDEPEEEEDVEENSADAEEESLDDESSFDEESEPEPPARVIQSSPKNSSGRDAGERFAQPDERRNPPPPAPAQDEDDDEDSDQWRHDGPSAEQLKGLSKRQRRALIKQHRDRQRELRGR